MLIKYTNICFEGLTVMSNYNLSLNNIIWSTTESNNLIFYLQRYIIFITRINLQNGEFNA